MRPTNAFPGKTGLTLSLLLCSLFGAQIQSQAQAINGFTGVGTSTATRSIGTPGNWSTGHTPTNNEVLVFGYNTSPGVGVNGTQSLLNDNTNFNVIPVSIVFSNVDRFRIGVKGNTNKFLLNSGGITVDSSCAYVTSANVTISTISAPDPDEQFYQYFELSANSTFLNNSTNVVLHIRQDQSMYNSNNFFCIDNKGFTLTFDGPGTNSFFGPSVGTHAGGAIKGSGGLTQKGVGATQLRATNTYSGPTLVSAGQLATVTWSSGGGTYTVADNASLAVTVASAGTTLNTSLLSLTNTTGAANTNTLILNLTSLGNPSVPVINASTLNINGNVKLTVGGSGLSVGTVPLIQYTTLTGVGTLSTNSLPIGVVGFLQTNTGLKQIQLVITDVPALKWVGNLSSTWDIITTSNWYDIANSVTSGFINGIGVRMDDTASTGTVVVSTNVAPSLLTVSNTSLTYSLSSSGSGYQINGAAAIVKDGTGTLNMGLTNSYSGYTYVKNGTLKLTSINAIGSASLITNNATLDLTGNSQNLAAIYGSGSITNSTSTPCGITLTASGADGGTYSGTINDNGTGSISLFKAGGMLTLQNPNSTYSGGTHLYTGGATVNRVVILGGNNVLGTGGFYWDAVGGQLTADASPRTLTNSIHFNITSADLGNTGAGLLTLAGPLLLETNVDSSITFHSDVNFTGPFNSTLGVGFYIKDGPGTLRLLNNSDSWTYFSNEPRISEGSLIVDGATVATTGGSGNFRVQCQYPNDFATLLITNGGSLTIPGDLRMGDVSPASCTNTATIYGTLNASTVVMGYASSNGTQLATLNLMTGSQVTLTAIVQDAHAGDLADTEVHLNGTTIYAPSNSVSSYLQGMTNVFVDSGGVTFYGANTNSLHIRQNLLAGTGSGGLIWNTSTGATLQLDGTNTYNGTTQINAGNLGGSGIIAGTVVIATGAQLTPAGSGTVGTLSVNNLTMNSGSTARMELNTTNIASAATNDYLVINGTPSLAGATLNVVNNGPALVAGNSFKLFSKGVSFTTVNLPTLTSGLSWNNQLSVNGTISVGTGTVTPIPLTVVNNGTSLQFSWSGSGYKLIAQTNSLGVGLSNNWFYYPGGSVSPVTVNIDPSQKTVFFGLSQ